MESCFSCCQDLTTTAGVGQGPIALAVGAGVGGFFGLQDVIRQLEHGRYKYY